MTLDLDKLLRRLIRLRRSRKTSLEIPERDVVYLAETAEQIFREQPVFLELSPPIVICGDIHGQFHDLLRLLEQSKYPPESNYLFLGDYVDRGRNSIEVLCLLLIYKIKYPENVFLLRGNHETLQINAIYGFLTECRSRYSLEVYHVFNEMFAWMPLAALVADKIFCCHGGISPSLRSVEAMRNVERPLREIPDEGLACDVMWADPYEGSGFKDSDRGVSFLFGKDALDGFLDHNDIDLVARGHQVVEDGFEFFAGRSLVTLFSAPNYCNEFDNAAAVMTVTDEMTCKFRILRPKTRRSLKQ